MKRFRYPLSPLLSLIAALVLSGAVTLLVLWMHPVSTMGMLKAMAHQPLILVLNWLPLFLLLAAFGFLLKNVFYTAALVGVVSAGLSLANRLKIQIRDDPLVPRDFGLLKEAADAAKSYEIQMPWGLIACILIFAAGCVVLGLLLPAQPFSKDGNKDWPIRLAGFLGCGAVLVCAVTFGYSSEKLYKSLTEASPYELFTVSNPYNLAMVCNELGFPYYFSYHFSTYRLEKPEGFDKAEAAGWESGAHSGSGKDINVVFVMNEAFSDLSNDPVFTYSEAENPVATYNALAAGPNAASGHIVVPGFAGGTANTEFDVLTGMQTQALNTNSAFRSFNRNLDSLFRSFEGDGYHTTFLHPGDAWFYNRENVYLWMGAEDILFAPDFENSRSKGRWVTDETVTDNILSRFHDHLAAGQSVFDYAVTIQNHMSYTSDKYGEDYDFPPVKTNAALSEEAQTLLRVYFEGLRDADAMLKTLTEDFAACGEPVVLVFFGDHLPYLGDNRQAYRELGLPIADESGDVEDSFCSYETPYLIWCNDEAAAQVDLDALDLPEDGLISASWLGAAVLELTGRGDETPWFAFINDLRRELPVIHDGLYKTADGEIVSALPEALQQKVSQWHDWTYYKIKYKKVG